MFKNIYLFYFFFILTLVNSYTYSSEAKIRFGYQNQPSNILTMIIINQGLFKKNGLNVTATPYTTGKLVIKEGLEKNKIDLGTAAETPFIYHILNPEIKNKAYLLASIFSDHSVNRVIVDKRKVKNVKQLKNKNIGTQKNSNVHYFFSQYLLSNELENKVKTSFHKSTELPLKLYNGEIDGFSNREPFISQAKKLLKENFLELPTLQHFSQDELLLVNHKFIDKNKEVISKFLNAYKQAADWLANHPKQAKNIMAKHLNISIESVDSIFPTDIVKLELSQRMLLSLENIGRWFIKEDTKKKLPQTLPNVLNYIYFKPLEKVSPKSIRIIR
jgi:ABC-type nitrate/sulfonate/bicarbonate transport system substrate-binding protein